MSCRRMTHNSQKRPLISTYTPGSRGRSLCANPHTKNFSVGSSPGEPETFIDSVEAKDEWRDQGERESPPLGSTSTAPGLSVGKRRRFGPRPRCRRTGQTLKGTGLGWGPGNVSIQPEWSREDWSESVILVTTMGRRTTSREFFVTVFGSLV